MRTEARNGMSHRVAVIVPSSNTVLENDLHLALPKPQVTVHTDRMYLVETTREAEIRMIEDHAPAAAGDLGTLEPDLLIFGCTSGGALFGLEYDAQICRNLGERAGCECIGVISSVESALAEIEARRVAVLTPYNEDLTTAVATAVETTEREVVAAHGMGITVNRQLAEPTPSDIVSFGRRHLDGLSFDAVFVSCTNFRAYEAREQLAEALGTPVVTSNSAVIDTVGRRIGL